MREARHFLLLNNMATSKNLLKQIVIGLIFDNKKEMFARVGRKGNSYSPGKASK